MEAVYSHFSSIASIPLHFAIEGTLHNLRSGLDSEVLNAMPEVSGRGHFTQGRFKRTITMPDLISEKLWQALKKSLIVKT